MAQVEEAERRLPLFRARHIGDHRVVGRFRDPLEEAAQYQQPRHDDARSEERTRHERDRRHALGDDHHLLARNTVDEAPPE